MPQKRKEIKVCPRCHVEKKRAEFYETKGGISSYCRSCYAERHKKEGLQSVLEAAKKYRESAKGRAYHKDFMAKAGSKYRDKAVAEGKVNARYMARYYLEKKPCESCGSMSSQAHHHDYSKPLEVVWLCPAHHADEHRKHV